MNTAETHALLAHLPLTGSVMGIFLLLLGLITSSYRTQMAGHLLLVAASAGAFLVFLSGSDLQYNSKSSQTVSNSSIFNHASFANYALIVMCCSGILSLSSLWLNIRKSVLVKTITPVVIATAFISIAAIAFTGYLGLQIRQAATTHTAVPEIPAPAFNKNAAVSITGQ
jgi:uncharacterized membrane protein